MRTYGRNGGEKQLAQMFACTQAHYKECFAFVYRDDPCESLLRANAPTLGVVRLLPFSVPPRYSPWAEFLILLPFLPILQLRLLWLLWRRRCRIGIVHGFQAALIAWPAAVLMRGVGFAYVHRITKSPRGSRAIFKLLYLPFRKVAGVSQAVTESLAPLVPRAKLVALPNGVDAARYAAPVDKPKDTAVIISVGRLLAHKGHDLAIRAYARIVTALPETQFWIAGDGEYRPQLESLVGALGVAGRVRLLGRREDVPALLGGATLFVHASEWEGMSNSVLEAMAAGLPSVVVEAPGVTECHVPGETAFIVPRDCAALAAAILALAREPARRERMGRMARARVEQQYSIEANRRHYVLLYRSLTIG